MHAIRYFIVSMMPIALLIFGCKTRQFNDRTNASYNSTSVSESSPWPLDLPSLNTQQIHDIVGDTGRCREKKNDSIYPLFQLLYAEYVKWLVLEDGRESKSRAKISPGTLIEHKGKNYTVIMTLGEGTRGISLWVRDEKGAGQPIVIKLMKLYTDTNAKKEALHYQFNHKVLLPSVLLSRTKPFPFSGLVDYLDLDEKTKLEEAPAALGTLRLKAIKGISGLFLHYNNFLLRKDFYKVIPKYPAEIEERAGAFLTTIWNYMGPSDVVENFVLDVDCLSIAKIDPG